MASISEPRPFDLGSNARFEPLSCRGPDGLLDDDPDPARHERRDPHEGVAAEAGQPGARIDRRRVDEVRRHLDARDEIAAGDDLPVEPGEHLERVDAVEPFEIADPNVEDTIRLGDEVDATLGRPPRDEPRAGDGRGEADGRLVLVQFACLRNEEADRVAGIGAGERRQVLGREPPTLRPASPRHRQVTRQDRPDEARGYPTPRGDAMDLHAAAGTVGRPT